MMTYWADQPRRVEGRASAGCGYRARFSGASVIGDAYTERDGAVRVVLRAGTGLG